MAPQHPMQPIILAPDGLRRFKENKIVRFLLKHGGYDLNKLLDMEFSQEDWDQFAQLIGYSLEGYNELSYVSTKAKQQANKAKWR